MNGNGTATTRNSRRRKQKSPPRRDSSSNNVICSSLLLFCLLLMGLLTISLNIMYVQLHRHYHSKKQHTATTTDADITAVGHQETKVDRHGNVLHRAIQKVTLQDLGLHDDSPSPLENLTKEELEKGKEPLLQLLQEAGVTDMETGVLQKLPTWNTIQSLYGPGPVLYGKETCRTFRETIPQQEASLGVAGIFNTGTNLMALYLEANCKLPHNVNRNSGIRWQVPWGKHMLAAFKWKNTAGHETATDKKTVLPVVLVRDPYSWMRSMCKNHYGARWHYTDDHCPNLVPNEHDYKLFPYAGPNIPVRLDFGGNVSITSYDSLAHLWSEWYRQYYQDADYPRIMVRYEDLMFHPKQLTREICTCAGGVPVDDDKFTFLVDSAKWGPGHGKEEQRTSLIPAMIKYGNVEKRLQGYTDQDLQLAHVALSEDLMTTFQYNRPLENDLRTTIASKAEE